MLVFRPTNKTFHLLLQCISRRYYGITPSAPATPYYSHLSQIESEFQLVVPARRLWRDNQQQHDRIGRIAKAFAKAAEENMKLSESDTSLLASPDGYLSASQWPAIAPARLRMFWHPTNDVNLVLPKESEPSNQEVARYQNFLSPEKDKFFFLSPSAWSFANTYDDGVASTVARALYRLLKARDTGYDEEDKVELYTDDFFSTLRDYMNIEDVLGHNCNTLRGQTITGTIFGNKYSAKPNFVLEDRGGAFQAFIENKQPKDSQQDVFANNVAQKMAEALAIATHRFVTPSKQSSDESQEVFGIGLRHYYFTFWHAIFSREYLNSVISVQHQWQGNECVIFKSYPYSQFGLDFCDPAQRKDILRYIHRILNYLQ